MIIRTGSRLRGIISTLRRMAASRRSSVGFVKAVPVFLASWALLTAVACRKEQASEPSEPVPTVKSADGQRESTPIAEAAPEAVSAAVPQELQTSLAEAPVVIPDPSDEEIEYQILELLATRRAAVVEDPASLGAWMNFGIACDAHKLYGCAEACYRQCIALAPNDFASVYYLAYVLYASAKYEKFKTGVNRFNLEKWKKSLFFES